MNELQLLKKEVDELKAWKASLEMSHSIPLNIDQAFRARFSSSGSVITDSGDGGTVNTSSYNSFNVLVPNVTGKRTLVVDGTEYDFLYQ